MCSDIVFISPDEIAIICFQFIARKLHDISESSMGNLAQAIDFAFAEFQNLDNSTIPEDQRPSSGTMEKIFHAIFS